MTSAENQTILNALVGLTRLQSDVGHVLNTAGDPLAAQDNQFELLDETQSPTMR